MIPLAAVIGSPVAHSRSPALFAHWLSKYGIPGHYVPIDVPPERLDWTLQVLPLLGVRGINVTIPHKEAVLEFAHSVTDRAALIGAANTLTYKEDGTILADNTDGYGFIRNLYAGAPGWDPASGVAAVMGAGGAARAVISALIEVGVAGISLTNRSRGRAEALRREFGPKIRVFDWTKAGNVIEDAALVVNTTSLGMTNGPQFRVPLDGLHEGQVVTDLVYTPLETPLLKAARERGATAVDGLGMLLHQAVPGFERWFGRRPEVDAAARAAALAAP